MNTLFSGIVKEILSLTMPKALFIIKKKNILSGKVIK